jgi:hypothetical protein
MAVIQRATNLHVDEAPLWLPRHDEIVVEQASARPPDFVDGYTLQSRLMAAALGSRWKIATTVSTALAVVLFLAVLPSLSDAGIGTMIKLAVYQSWTLGLMLIVTARVRSITAGTIARYWLVGMFTVAMIAYFANGPLANLASPSTVWITPILEEILKAAPFAVALFMGRRAWRHPGLSDLMLLGFAVGAGYAFHEEALWERSAVSGFEVGVGLFVPSVFQLDGFLVVGHAVWTSIIGLAIGLLILHRGHPGAVLAAIFAVVAVVGDHMAVNDAEGTIDWVRQLSFNGKLLAIVFVVGVGAASILDHRRLATTSARDHLFPSEQWYGSRVTDVDAEHDPLMAVLAGRYRRLRNGIHTTVDAAARQWPPRSEDHPAPLAELARLGRAAAVAVGPGTSSSGWAPDPEALDGFRFVGPSGFTAYAASAALVEPDSTTVPVQSNDNPAPAHPDSENPGLANPDLGDSDLGDSYLDDPDLDVSDLADSELDDSELDDPDLDDAAGAALEEEDSKAAKPARRRERIEGTTTSISTPKARVEAAGLPLHERPPLFWRHLGLGIAAVGLLVALRLLTADDPSTALIEPALSLPDATNSPALIQGVLGAVAAAVSIRGRDPAEVGAGWEVGPADDPTSDQSDECEA